MHSIDEPLPPHRDLVGYGPNPPHASWPGGARVAVSLVLNLEEGSEQALTHGDDRNEHVYDMIEALDDAPNLTMESHFDYGSRAGYWRIVRILERFGATCTVNACAEAVDRNPEIALDALGRGYEISCHGERWLSHIRMTPTQEAASIRRAVRRIESVCGVRPIGWHTRCPHTPDTRRLLIEEGGFVYDSDAYDDDLPYFFSGAPRPYVIVPYSLDTNDMRFQRPDSPFITARHFAEYVNNGFDCLLTEGATAPKMMTIGLHTRTIGRPSRSRGLEMVLAHMAAAPPGSVWFATRADIARHWLKTHGG